MASTVAGRYCLLLCDLQLSSEWVIVMIPVYLTSPQSPGEIKRREVSWTLTNKLAQKRSRAGRWLESWTSFASVVSQRRSYGHSLCDCCEQQLGQQLCGALVAAQCWTDSAVTLFFVVLAAVHGVRVGDCFEVSLFCSPFSHSSPSLIGLLASVDFKQQSLSHT